MAVREHRMLEVAGCFDLRFSEGQLVVDLDDKELKISKADAIALSRWILTEVGHLNPASYQED